MVRTVILLELRCRCQIAAVTVDVTEVGGAIGRVRRRFRRRVEHRPVAVPADADVGWESGHRRRGRRRRRGIWRGRRGRLAGRRVRRAPHRAPGAVGQEDRHALGRLRNRVEQRARVSALEDLAAAVDGVRLEEVQIGAVLVAAVDHVERHGQRRVRLHHGVVLVPGLGAQPVGAWAVREARRRVAANRASPAGAAAAGQAVAVDAHVGASGAALLDVEQAVRRVLAVVVELVRVLVRL